MFKKISFTAIVLVFAFMSTVSHAQLSGLYEFDGGGDGTSWDDATNWEQILDPLGNPISGNPATPPDAVTSTDLPLPGVVIDLTMPGQTALDVRIGTAAGVGSLSMSGGDLTFRDLFVGSDPGTSNAGSMDMSGGTLIAADDITVGNGSVGTMSMNNGAVSTADDFFVNIDSSFTTTGGTLFVGDRLAMDDNATLLVDGGDIISDDDFFFFGAAQITVNSGSMIVADKLRFDDVLTTGKLTINSGFVRSNEFGIVDLGDNYIMNGVVEINGDGFYQSEAPSGPSSPVSQLSVAAAQALIDEGIHFITSEVAPLKLGAFSVVVPMFDGRTDVVFTQVSVIAAPLAVDDVNAAPVNGSDGAVAAVQVFSNDTLNGAPVNPAEVTLTETVADPTGALTLNADGTVDVAPGTAAGSYMLTYQICENLIPSNCDTAIVTITVEAAIIDAVDDVTAAPVSNFDGAVAAVQVFSNDTLNGMPVSPADVTLTETVPDPTGALTLNPDGTVDVAPGSMVGSHMLTYQICENLNPGNCDTAIVTITVDQGSFIPIGVDAVSPLGLAILTMLLASFGLGLLRRV